MPNDIMELNCTQKEVGICLSGGGALGFAHVGVLQLLEEKGITPTQIAGSSMGTIIGTLYAAGISPQHMLEMIKDQKLYKITKLMTFRPSFLKSGLSSHQMLSELIKEVVPSNSFSSLKSAPEVIAARDVPEPTSHGVIGEFKYGAFEIAQKAFRLMERLTPPDCKNFLKPLFADVPDENFKGPF